MYEASSRFSKFSLSDLREAAPAKYLRYRHARGVKHLTFCKTAHKHISHNVKQLIHLSHSTPLCHVCEAGFTGAGETGDFL